MSSLSKEFFKRRLRSAEKHEPKVSASRSSRVLLKIPKCLYNSRILEEQAFFNFFYKMYREFRALVRRLIFQQYTHLT